jgi:hypothetical protein
LQVDDVALLNVNADMGVALMMEALTCYECEECAGCRSLVDDCGHALCCCLVSE